MLFYSNKHDILHPKPKLSFRFLIKVSKNFIGSMFWLQLIRLLIMLLLCDVSLTLCCFVVYSARRFVVCLSVCHFVLVFSVLLVLRFPRLGKRELILVLFVRLFGLCLFRFVGFLFLLGSGKGCGL